MGGENKKACHYLVRTGKELKEEEDKEVRKSKYGEGQGMASPRSKTGARNEEEVDSKRGGWGGSRSARGIGVLYADTHQQRTRKRKQNRQKFFKGG